VRPEYYGMLAFALAGKGQLLKPSLDKSDINLSTYATRDNDGVLWVVALNKDFTHDVVAEVSLPKAYSKAAVYRLAAPSMESTNHVTLAGAEVSNDGMWSPNSSEHLSAIEGAARVSLPHASAVLLRLKRE
jgi:hypothetical protein